jgi:hypothetical protein
LLWAAVLFKILLWEGIVKPTIFKMETKLNVKDKSVATFLEERLLGYKPDDRNGMNGMRENSAYHLMKDEMFFKKECGIEIGETVKIELFDRAQMSGKELLNTYVYEAEKYDDVAVKLVLKDFSVSQK